MERGGSLKVFLFTFENARIGAADEAVVLADCVEAAKVMLSHHSPDLVKFGDVVEMKNPGVAMISYVPDGSY